MLSFPEQPNTKRENNIERNICFILSYFCQKCTILNVELFIARKLVNDPNSRSDISKPIISISIAGIALGVAAMIISIAIVTGFKSTIKDKVFGFGSHINIVNFDSNSSYETVPINRNQQFIPTLEQIDGIKHIQVYATKAGIIKAESSIQGVVVKGVDTDFDWEFFSNNLTEGQLPQIEPTKKTNDVLISKKIADALELHVGGRFITTFISNNSKNPRYRKFTVSGIYETNLEDFDKIMILGDIKHIQKLNNWDSTQVSGFEISINDYDRLAEMHEAVWDEVGYGFLNDGSKLKTQSIESLYPQIFDWLSLLDMNVWVILILMTLVAGMNMISGLLVIILEKTNMIGILKAIGAKNLSVRKVFLYHGAFLVGRGLIYGNLLGIGLCAIQFYFEIFPLDAEMYFIHTVPINLNLGHILLVNAGSLIVTTAMLILPSFVITSVSPSEAIKFG